MNNETKREALKKALEETGNAWLLDYWGEAQDSRLDEAIADLEAFAAEYERRFGEHPDPFRLLSEDPYKAKAFFQVDTFLASIEMKIMIWRILLGCEIQQVQFLYQAETAADLNIVLQMPGAEEESYRGSKYTDFRVLRHFGVTGANGRLILQGYYALK
jgi:hypothetical protein